MKWIVPALLAMIAGCATTSASQDFLTSMYAASSLNNTVLTTVDSLAKQKAVSTDQVNSVLAVTDKAQAALTLANTLYAAGNAQGAAAKLAAAAGTLTQVQSCLAVPASLVVCLQGVSTP